MKKKLVFYSSILVCDIIMLYLYTLLHECGHAFIGLIFGGKVDKLVLGFNAHVQISGVVFTSLGEAVLNAAGMVLPFIIFTCALALYNADNKLIPYHIMHIYAALILVCSLLEWMVVPIASLFSGISGNSDVVNFLRLSGIHPLAVSAAALILIIFILLFFYKKEIIKQLKNKI